MKNILIINTYGIGDVLFTTPVLRNLRLAYPKASITYLSNARTADFLKVQSDIHKVIVYERDEFKGRLDKYLGLARTIRQEGFDVVFDFSNNSGLGFLAAVCGIPKRVGFDYHGRGRFLTERLPLYRYEARHVIEYDLDLLRMLNIPIETKAMKLDVPAADVQWAKDWLAAHEIRPEIKPLLVVMPGGGASWGASAKNKRWPAAQYAHLIDKIIENFDADIILLGDSKEAQLCRDVTRLAHFPVHFAVGETTVTKLAAMLMQAHGAIVNDGGPLHVAVACHTRTVSIFGPVDPLVYGPYPINNHLVAQKNLACQPCYRNFRQASCEHISCLNDLSVQEVYRKVESIL